jgi:hypothetical protein
MAGKLSIVFFLEKKTNNVISAFTREQLTMAGTD